MTINNEASEAAAAAPWTPNDERNWAADRAVLRDLKKRCEEPSEWLATEYRELNARRKAYSSGCAK